MRGHGNLPAAGNRRRGQDRQRTAGMGEVSLPGPGRAEIDADEVWAAVAGCLRTASEQLDRSSQGLAIAVQGETVLPVGADGEALAMAPVSTDARAVEETAAIIDAVGARRLRVITGQRPHPMFSIGKIAWMRRVPGLWQRVVRFCCLGDFLALRMGVRRRPATRWPPGPWPSAAASRPGPPRS